MTTLVDCVDTESGKAGIIVTAGHAMELIHKGYSHKEDICFYVFRDSYKDKKNKAAFSVSQFKKEHKTQLFHEMKFFRSRGNKFLKLDREDKEGVMRHVIAVWKDGEEPDPAGVAISRVQPGSIYWFLSEKNRNIVHDWITKKPKGVPKKKEDDVVDLMLKLTQASMTSEEKAGTDGLSNDDMRAVVLDTAEELWNELKKKKETKSCVLCDGEYEGEGNNSLPIMEGLCCDKCNTEKVIPARLEKYKSGKSAEEPKSDSDSSYDSDEEKLLNDMGFSLWDTAKKPKRPLILTTKQMDMMYWIVETTYRGEDVIERVGEARYEVYYPLYVLLKKLKNSKIFMNWLLKPKSTMEEFSDKEVSQEMLRRFTVPQWYTLDHFAKRLEERCDLHDSALFSKLPEDIKDMAIENIRRLMAERCGKVVDEYLDDVVDGLMKPLDEAQVRRKPK